MAAVAVAQGSRDEWNDDSQLSPPRTLTEIVASTYPLTKRPATASMKVVAKTEHKLTVESETIQKAVWVGRELQLRSTT